MGPNDKVNKGYEKKDDKNLDFDYKRVVPEHLHFIYELVGRTIYEKILEEGGGTSLYLQSKKSYDMSVKSRQIYNEYMVDRTTYKSLAKKYKVSENTIRNVIKKCMDEDRKNK